MRRLLLAGAALMASGTAQAVQTPKPVPQDSRVTTVVYDPRNVVRVDAEALQSTIIQFGKDEVCCIVSAGDPKAWDIKQFGGPFAIIKPGSAAAADAEKSPPGPRAETNLQLITHDDKGTVRVYLFDLVAHAPGSDAHVDTSISFTYPGEVLAARRKAAAERAKRREVAEITARLEQAKFYGQRNLAYEGRGSISIKPSGDGGGPAVSDNGEQTVFRFPGRADIPAIYTVDASPADRTCSADPGPKHEQITNPTRQGDMVIVSGIAKEWRLRDGKAVYDVCNVGYDARGYNPQTGTVSPDVVLKLKGAGNG